MKRAVQIFVNQRRGSHDSLEDLARNFGVEKILEERLPFEGGLFRAADGKLVIKLNTQSSLARRRFTLAHELGHLLLGTIPGRRSKDHSDAVLERACDCIAAELLMPTEKAVPYVRELGSPCPEKLRAIASRFKVSLQVAAIRVCQDFLLWKCGVGYWERSPQPRTIWFVGQRRWNKTEPDAYSLYLATGSNTSVSVTELWASGQFTETVWLSLLHVGNDPRSGADRILGLIASVH
jgi:hypothetical protein